MELRRELTVSERSALIERVSDLEGALMPYSAAERTSCAAAISGMIGAFTVMHRYSASVAATITTAYLWTLRDRPRWAIEKVCSDIREGKADLAPNYCPNEPEINIAIGKVLEPYNERLRLAKSLLNASVSTEA